MAMVDIKGLDKAQVLITLWEASRMQGVSCLGYGGKMTVKKAEQYLKDYRHVSKDGKETIYFDYLNGKVMKIDIAPDVIDTRLYDRDNGEGAGERAIRNLRLALQVANGELTYDQLIEKCKQGQLYSDISYEEFEKIIGKKKPIKF